MNRIQKENHRTWVRLGSIPEIKSSYFYKCVSCGGDVTTGNIRFYDNDVTRVKCYGCQNINPENL